MKPQPLTTLQFYRLLNILAALILQPRTTPAHHRIIRKYVHRLQAAILADSIVAANAPYTDRGRSYTARTENRQRSLNFILDTAPQDPTL